VWITKYVERTARHRSFAVWCEVVVVVILFLTVPLIFGATFQLRYGRLFFPPLVLGTCWLDYYLRRRATRSK
jgi:hypothetical protein